MTQYNDDYVEALEVLADLTEDHLRLTDCSRDNPLLEQLHKVNRYRLADAMEDE